MVLDAIFVAGRLTDFALLPPSSNALRLPAEGAKGDEDRTKARVAQLHGLRQQPVFLYMR